MAGQQQHLPLDALSDPGVPEKARQPHQASAWLVKSEFSAILPVPTVVGLAKGLFQSGWQLQITL
jgi:hypothetical protein